MTEILLGDKVKCVYTGFTGYAVAKVQFINGCVQWTVAPKVKPGDKYPEETCIDDGSLKIITKGPLHKKEVSEEESGGPSRVGKKMKGY